MTDAPELLPPEGAEDWSWHWLRSPVSGEGLFRWDRVRRRWQGTFMLTAKIA